MNQKIGIDCKEKVAVCRPGDPMKKTVIALCASLLVNLINPVGLKAWGWTELVVSNGKKQAEMIQTEQTGERDSLSVQVQAPCAVLMEASTGQIHYEKNAG